VTAFHRPNPANGSLRELPLLIRRSAVPTLRQLNIKESDLVPLAEGMMKDVCFSFMPVKLGLQDALKLIQELYAL